jgi:hypothetical protein
MLPIELAWGRLHRPPDRVGKATRWSRLPEEGVREDDDGGLEFMDNADWTDGRGDTREGNSEECCVGVFIKEEVF